MKKIFLTVVSLTIILLLSAQTPQAFKYQAVARNNTGNVLDNQNVSFQISILQGSAAGTSVYIETHTAMTNEFGLVNLEIGNGTVVTGLFADIEWGNDNYFLKIGMDETNGTNYQLMGISQMHSVPYALHAKSVEDIDDADADPTNEYQSFSVSGDTLFISNGNYVILPGVSPLAPCEEPISDIDGNTYNIVGIGTQCWMVENLKTTTYRNGTPIPNVTDDNAWNNLITGAYVWFDNDISWKGSYGALYNWFTTVDTNGLCPTGWHVSTYDEWLTLTDFIGGTSSPHGSELKSCRQVNTPLGGGCNTTIHPRWDEGVTNHGTDDYGFSGLPGSMRNSLGTFFTLGYWGYWWFSTETSLEYASYSRLRYDFGSVSMYSDGPKLWGYSVRCLRD